MLQRLAAEAIMLAEERREILRLAAAGAAHRPLRRRQIADVREDMRVGVEQERQQQQDG
jgi:hypothetical protein